MSIGTKFGGERWSVAPGILGMVVLGFCGFPEGLGWSSGLVSLWEGREELQEASARLGGEF